MTISDLIRDQRDRLDLTLEDIGRVCGVSRATVSRWESGEIKKINRKHMEELAGILQIDPVLLMSEPELLTPEERLMLKKFRNASTKMRQAAMVLLDMDGDDKEAVEGIVPYLRK